MKQQIPRREQMRRTLRWSGSCAAGCAIVLVLASCGAPRPSPSSPPSGAKPPVDAAALEPDYRDALMKIGLVLTPRGGLIDRSGGGYTKSAEGTHLALYLEPVAKRSVQEYVDGIAAASRVFLPDVFERWPGLESFDVCQEPPATTDEPKDPPPVTQIEVTRVQAAGVNWRTATVSDLVRAAVDRPPRLKLVVSQALQASDAYVNATGPND
jgi:hypothetical protein